jgi:hypothetical protein
MGRALIFHGYIWIEFCGRLDIYAVARSQRVTKKTGDRKRWRESRRWGIARGYEGGSDSHRSYSDSGQLEKYLKRKKRQRSRTSEKRVERCQKEKRVEPSTVPHGSKNTSLLVQQFFFFIIIIFLDFIL